MSVCVEKKLTLSGKLYSFECELLYLSNGFGALKYVIDREYNVGGITLRPGDITYAFYWTDRPYTLYIWHLSRNRVIHYFNIADSISLPPTEFVWRDLAVDILIDSDRKISVLDEDELPADLDFELSRYIHAAKSAVLLNHDNIVREADCFVNKLLEIR